MTGRGRGQVSAPAAETPAPVDPPAPTKLSTSMQQQFVPRQVQTKKPSVAKKSADTNSACSSSSQIAEKLQQSGRSLSAAEEKSTDWSSATEKPPAADIESNILEAVGNASLQLAVPESTVNNTTDDLAEVFIGDEKMVGHAQDSPDGQAAGKPASADKSDISEAHVDTVDVGLPISAAVPSVSSTTDASATVLADGSKFHGIQEIVLLPDTLHQIFSAINAGLYGHAGGDASSKHDSQTIQPASPDESLVLATAPAIESGAVQHHVKEEKHSIEVKVETVTTTEVDQEIPSPPSVDLIVKEEVNATFDETESRTAASSEELPPPPPAVALIAVKEEEQPYDEKSETPASAAVSIHNSPTPPLLVSSQSAQFEAAVALRPDFLCEPVLLDNPHIVSIHAIGSQKTSEGLPTAVAPTRSIGSFIEQRDNREGIFAQKDVLASAKLPQQLDEYIVKSVIKDMKIVELPQQIFVGQRALDMFNVWKNRIYKQTMRKSVRTGPRRAQIGDSVVSQVSMRFMLFEIASEHANVGRNRGDGSKMTENFLINTFRDNSSWRFSIANVSSSDDAGGETEAAAAARQIPWLRRAGGDIHDEDDDDLYTEDAEIDDRSPKRIPVDHQTMFQCIVLAASTMQEGEYSRYMIQLPTPFVYGPCRVPADSWMELELLINKIEPIGSLQRVLAAPLPADSDDSTTTDAAQQQVVSFKDLQDAVDTDRRECRVLFNSGRWKEALFVCWRLRDHIQRYRVLNLLPDKIFESDSVTETAESVAARAATDAAQTQQQIDKEHLLSQVYVNISRCLAKINDYGAACESAELALNYNPNNTSAMFMCLRTLFRAGLYAQARDKLQKFQRECPMLLSDNDEFIKLATQLDKKLQLSKEVDRDVYRRMMKDFNDKSGMLIMDEAESSKNDGKPVAELDDEAEDDVILENMSQRVDRKFARQARQILSRFRGNTASVSAAWPEKFVSFDEAQYIKALNLKQEEKEKPATLIDVELTESMMSVGKFLVMLRKKHASNAAAAKASARSSTPIEAV